MKTLHLCKFDPLAGQIPEDAEIRIDSPIPTFESVAEAELCYQAEASALAGLLFASLHQGTMDRLLVALMRQKLSLYRGRTQS